jgi:hypothetical protein
MNNDTMPTAEEALRHPRTHTTQSDHPQFHRYSWARVPGDIRVRGEGWSFSFPIVTSIVVSIVLTILLSLILRIFRR